MPVPLTGCSETKQLTHQRGCLLPVSPRGQPTSRSDRPARGWDLRRLCTSSWARRVCWATGSLVPAPGSPSPSLRKCPVLTPDSTQLDTSKAQALGLRTLKALLCGKDRPPPAGLPHPRQSRESWPPIHTGAMQSAPRPGLCPGRDPSLRLAVAPPAADRPCELGSVHLPLQASVQMTVEPTLG